MEEEEGRIRVRGLSPKKYSRTWPSRAGQPLRVTPPLSPVCSTLAESLYRSLHLGRFRSGLPCLSSVPPPPPRLPTGQDDDLGIPAQVLGHDMWGAGLRPALGRHSWGQLCQDFHPQQLGMGPGSQEMRV